MIITGNYRLAQIGKGLKLGTHRITALVSGGIAWPDDPHYYAIDDLANQTTVHVRVADRPTWGSRYHKNVGR